MYLRRYHDVVISLSGVWRIVKRLGLNRLPASERHNRLDRRWQRYEKKLPGHQVHADVKFIAAAESAGKKRWHQFIPINDGTRLMALRALPAPGPRDGHLLH